MLNQVILEFRDAFSFNPGIYKDLEEDMADYDTALEFPTMQEMFENWQAHRQSPLARSIPSRLALRDRVAAALDQRCDA